MGRHSKPEQPEDEPGSSAQAPPGRPLGPSTGPRYDGFTGPTDDQVFVSRPGNHRRPREHGPASGGPRTGPQIGPRATLPDGAPTVRPGQGVPPPPGSGPPAGPLGPGSAGPVDAGPAGGTGANTSKPRRVARFVGSLPFPLMPIVALVIAVGIVSYALSTQQISLNFAGGVPKDPQATANDGQVLQHGPGQGAEASGGRPDGLVVAFAVASRDADGFEATATIANQGERPVAEWALAFKIPNAVVAEVRGAAVAEVGRLTKVHGTTAIPAGDAVKIVFTASGTPAKPTYCVLNELECALA
ncbi:cellulose binding domain-containing protein [Actinomadura sediminis]|uniref:Cellulose binding domain-containing protein n=1 Tax=Actinomadura sediminis TaxID=1038904 RepID=A0ABW3EY99_9ACTN